MSARTRVYICGALLAVAIAASDARAAKMLDDHEKVALAIELLRRGARMGVTLSLTQLPAKRLRTLFREVTGHPPQGGPVPQAGGRMIQTRRLQIHASLFAILESPPKSPRERGPVQGEW